MPPGMRIWANGEDREAVTAASDRRMKGCLTGGAQVKGRKPQG